MVISYYLLAAKEYGWTTAEVDNHDLDIFFDLFLVSQLINPHEETEDRAFIDQIL